MTDPKPQIADEPVEEAAGAPKPSRAGKILRLVAWNVVLFLVLAEVAGLAGYALRTGTLYYTNPPRGKSVPPMLSTVESYRIHPYFGFIIRPGARDTSEANQPSGDLRATAYGQTLYNNYGFDSPWDYPVARRDGELLVGIFGGSVASKLAAYEGREGIIAHRLAEATGRAPEQIRVLNFGQGGYKQPQQVQMLAYFLSIGQELDAVALVDGFNEIALGALNQASGLSPAMPSIEHVRALQEVTALGAGSEGLETMRRARRAYADFARIFNRAWSGEAWETRFAAGFLFDFLRYKIHDRTFHSLRESLLDERREDADRLSWFYLHPAAAGADRGSEQVDWAPVLGVWREGARTFADLARGAGLAHVHVLQPNQYFATDRVFSEAESAVAFNQASPYRTLIPDGYPALADAARALSADPDDPAEVHDLMRLFDDLEAPAYEDDCCHYTDAGNELLAREVGELLAAQMTFSED